MTPELNRDDDIFAEALELSATERAAFLDSTCAGDPVRRARIEALLAGHEAARSFLEQPLTDRPTPTAEENPGQSIGPYKLLRRIGEGGCGVVWLAEQTAPLRRLVALKVIKLGMDTRSVIARFEAERQTLALMTHPDIARVYDAGATEAGRPYFVMEYVEGMPITHFCDHHGMGMTPRLELFSRVCLALQHAHQKGIIHRDLKPSNILVALRDGEFAPKVIDFGIAKATEGRLTGQTLVTELGQFLGTPAYMSPEQAEQRDLDLDTRSDVYALGVLLYELLTGRPPYDPKELVRAGLVEIRRIIREVDPPRPSTVISTLNEADRDTVARLRGAAAQRLSAALRGDLDWIVMRCLEKDRDRRYGTAAALAEDVRRHLRSEPVEARPPQPFYRLGKFVARNRLACVSVAAVAVSLVAGTIVSTFQAVRATRAEQTAAAERDTARAAQKAESVARADAQRRREQAEDLLTFMLGDFRAELAKIGKLNLLDSVGGKAMAYFTALDPRDLTDEALTRQAKALTQIGEVRMEQARFPEAEQAFTAAYDRAAALATRHPGNGDMIFERGQAEYWIGFAARSRGNRAVEREWLVRYRDSALALAAAEGPTARAELELIYGHHNLAVLDLDGGKLAAARQGFETERTTNETLLKATPANADLLYRRADVASWLGSVAAADGRLGESAAQFAAMDSGYEALTRLEPAVARWRFERAQALVFLGGSELIVGRKGAAEKAYAQGRQLLDELTARDAANKRWLAASLGLHVLQAALALSGPEPAAQEAALHEARAGLESLVAAQPASQIFLRRLVLARRMEARVQLAGGRLAEAAAAIAPALVESDRLMGGARADAWIIYECAHAYIQSAQIAQALGRATERQAALAKALDLAGPGAKAGNDWRLLEPAALAATFAGEADLAGPLIARLKNLGYHPADPLIAVALGLAASTPTPPPPPSPASP